jgi:hypothetical protein
MGIYLHLVLISLCHAAPCCALLCAAGYPEARAALDLEALQLQPFYAGARVWFDGGWHTVGLGVSDPAALQWPMYM